MNKYDCQSEKTSSRTVGLIIMALAIIIGLVGSLLIPILGFLFALPLMILAALFFVAPESKVCKLILEKNLKQ